MSIIPASTFTNPQMRRHPEKMPNIPPTGETYAQPSLPISTTESKRSGTSDNPTGENAYNASNARGSVRTTNSCLASTNG